jgi:serine/threonine protein kinase
MEYVNGTTLADLLKARRLLSTDLESLFYQLIRGLEYLHSEQIVHRDIKPTNILIPHSEDFTIKYCDFGLAKEGHYMTTFCGSNLYAAPEIHEIPRKYSARADIWSVAVVMIEACRRLPRIPRSTQ